MDCVDGLWSRGDCERRCANRPMFHGLCSISIETYCQRLEWISFQEEDPCHVRFFVDRYCKADAVMVMVTDDDELELILQVFDIVKGLKSG